MVCSNDRFEIVLKPFITFPRIIMVVYLKGFRKQFEIRTKYLLVSIANFIMRKGTSMSTVRFVNWGAVLSPSYWVFTACHYRSDGGRNSVCLDELWRCN